MGCRAQALKPMAPKLEFKLSFAFGALKLTPQTYGARSVFCCPLSFDLRLLALAAWASCFFLFKGLTCRVGALGGQGLFRNQISVWTRRCMSPRLLWMIGFLSIIIQLLAKRYPSSTAAHVQEQGCERNRRRGPFTPQSPKRQLQTPKLNQTQDPQHPEDENAP